MLSAVFYYFNFLLSHKEEFNKFVFKKNYEGAYSSNSFMVQEWEKWSLFAHNCMAFFWEIFSLLL